MIQLILIFFEPVYAYSRNIESVNLKIFDYIKNYVSSYLNAIRSIFSKNICTLSPPTSTNAVGHNDWILSTTIPRFYAVITLSF